MLNGLPAKDARRLYGDLAWIWPIISPVEEYAQDEELLASAIREDAQIPVKTLLDIGCGGGHLDHHLKKHFQISAADISESMLALARKLNPEISHHQGDMRTMRLGRLFDAVLIYDAINYMRTPEELQAAFRTAFAHLKPGGLFLTLAEVTAESFQQNKTFVRAYSRGDVELIFIENYYDPDTQDTTYESTFLYLIRQRGKLTVEMDRHLVGVFPLETWRQLLKQVGFQVQQRKFEHSDFAPGEPPPLLACIKPS
jgi:SAM-dependent methyltransferase